EEYNSGQDWRFPTSRLFKSPVVDEIVKIQLRLATKFFKLSDNRLTHRSVNLHSFGDLGVRKKPVKKKMTFRYVVAMVETRIRIGYFVIEYARPVLELGTDIIIEEPVLLFNFG